MLQEAEVTAASVLRNKPFLLLWLAQALSQTVQNTVFYALMVLVEKATGSSIHMGFLILSTIFPILVMGMAAGVLVDRWRKRNVLIITNVLRGIIVLAFLFFPGNLVVIYSVNLLFSAVAQFFAPAELAAIPLLVPKRQLLSANGMFNLTFYSSQLAGFVIVGPLLLKALGVGPLMIVVAATFVLCGVLTSLLPAKEPPRETSPYSGASLVGGMTLDLRDGWHVLRGDRVISLALLHLTLTGAFMLVMGMLAPGYVSRILRLEAEDTVFILAPGGIGAAISLLTLPRLAIYFAKERMATIGLAVMALGMIGMSAVGTIILMLGPDSRLSIFVTVVMLLAFGLGVAFALINVPAQTIVQERTPLDMRGRIFAAQITLQGAATVLPLLFLGGLADLIGINLVFLLIAVVLAGVALFNHRRKDLRSVTADD